ncbi:MAG: DUF1624 domain-containing protein [Crocinitomicaceae bacterium]|nr:DUF1624 domain-containing protein [Crocinitomicaceae bacterium]
MSSNVVDTKPKTRLQFIDMTRSLAILLMLEGHFVDITLSDAFRRPDSIAIFTDNQYYFYDAWEYLRGLTAPIFLTITGVVFVYLLVGNEGKKFSENPRVIKGFKRVIELFFWGYVLQFCSFHILECIAVGLFIILLLYGLYKFVRFIPLWCYFFAVGTFIFLFDIYIEQLPAETFWPVNAPFFIQNMLRGPAYLVRFPIFPWLGFTLYGAFIGSLLFQFKTHVLKFYFPFIFLISGFILFYFSYDILNQINLYFFNGKFERLPYIEWLYFRFGIILIIIGILNLLNVILGTISNNIFLKVGQYTLTIFVVHFIILYGRLTGIGITNILHHALNPIQTFIGVTLFIAFFMYFIHRIDYVNKKMEFIAIPARRFWDAAFESILEIFVKKKK